jgi:hypothetical protein
VGIAGAAAGGEEIKAGGRSGVSVEVVKNLNAGHDDHESCTKVTTSPTIPSCFCRGHCDQSAKNSVRNKLTTKNIFFHAEAKSR